MARGRAVLVCLCCCSAAALAEGGAERPLLAVLEFQTKLDAATRGEADPGYFTDVVRSQALDLLPEARLMTRENMLVLLEASGKDLAACEGECEVDTGRKLGADYVITGQLLKVGSHFKLDLKLHKTADGALLGGIAASGASVDELDTSVPAAVAKLLGPLRGSAGAPAPAQAAPVAQAPAQPGAAKQNPQIVYPPPGGVAQARPNPQVVYAPAGQPAKGAPPARFQHLTLQGDHVVQHEAFFEGGDRTLKASSAPMVQELAALLRGPPQRRALVSCRAERGKLRVARQRAWSLRNALVAMGAAPQSVVAEGVLPRKQARHLSEANGTTRPCEILLR